MAELLIAVALGVCAGTAVLLAVAATVRRAPRIRPGPATQQLPDDPEPPAVVNLLTEGFEVTPTAPVATLLDLAARDHLQLEWYGDHTICRLHDRSSPNDRLEPYERQVLERLQRRARGGVVPAGALAVADERVADRWLRTFAKQVIADARRRGLCRPRWSLVDAALVAGAALVAWGLAALAGALDPAALEDGTTLDTLRGLAVVGGVGLFAVSGRLARSLRQLPRPPGLEAAQRWLGVRAYLEDTGTLAEHPPAAVVVWRRHLAYAVGMGLAPTARAGLPLGTDDDEHAWSLATGSWRHVEIRYPRLRPGWGLHPLRALLRGAVVGGLAAATAWAAHALAADPGELGETVPFDLAAWADRVAAPLTGLAVVLVTYGAVLVVSGLLDLFATRTVDGVLLRQRERSFVPRRLRPWWDRLSRDDTGGPSEQPGNRRYLAVDDGTRERVIAWCATPRTFGVAREGTDVRVRVTPRLGYVRSVEQRTTTGAPRASTAGRA